MTVNTFLMFILRVNSSAASLARIEGYMVLFLFFSLAVSSMMATPFVDHVVRDIERESIQSQFHKLSSGFALPAQARHLLHRLSLLRETLQQESTVRCSQMTAARILRS